MRPKAICPKHRAIKGFYFSFFSAFIPLVFTACAPQTIASTQPSTPILIEGGIVEGRVARMNGSLLALPSRPLAIARSSELIYAAYPYQLLTYQNGLLQDTAPLPGVPTYIKAKPQLLIGFADKLFIPGRGTVEYKALDAINTKLGVFWLNDKGVHLERSRIAEGNFSFLAGNERYVYAMGREALRLQDSRRIALPNTPKAAMVLDDLYVLTQEGIYHLTLEGLRLGFTAGSFTGLESDGQRLYTLQDGKLVTLSLDLRVLSDSNQTPLSFMASPMVAGGQA